MFLSSDFVNFRASRQGGGQRGLQWRRGRDQPGQEWEPQLRQGGQGGQGGEEGEEEIEKRIQGEEAGGAKEEKASEEPGNTFQNGGRFVF